MASSSIVAVDALTVIVRRHRAALHQRVTAVRGVAEPLGLWLEVNGERVQDGTTGNMIFSTAHIVWYLSQFLVLEPGDVITIGTLAGVGLGLDPPRYLVEGDVMELGIDGQGTQRQVCARARP